MDTTRIKIPENLRQYEILVLESVRGTGIVSLRVSAEESYELGHHAMNRAKIVDQLSRALGVSSALTPVIDEWIDECMVYGNSVLLPREGMRVTHVHTPHASLLNFGFQLVEERLGIQASSPYIDPVFSPESRREVVVARKFRPSKTGKST
jgi:hypothetical protein